MDMGIGGGKERGRRREEMEGKVNEELQVVVGEGVGGIGLRAGKRETGRDPVLRHFLDNQCLRKAG